MKYLTAVQVLFIHSRIIDVTGGRPGIRDLSLLQSAVSRPRAMFDKKDLYPGLFQKVAALMESLIKNHPFIDGNKRTAIASAGIFLQMNGYVLTASQKDVVDFSVTMAAEPSNLDYAAQWFGKHSTARIKTD